MIATSLCPRRASSQAALTSLPLIATLRGPQGRGWYLRRAPPPDERTLALLALPLPLIWGRTGWGLPHGHEECDCFPQIGALRGVGLRPLRSEQRTGVAMTSQRARSPPARLRY